MQNDLGTLIGVLYAVFVPVDLNLGRSRIT